MLLQQVKDIFTINFFKWIRKLHGTTTTQTHTNCQYDLSLLFSLPEECKSAVLNQLYRRTSICLFQIHWSTYLLLSLLTMHHTTMDTASATVVHAYFPPGVQRILNAGSTSFICLLDDKTVLKYPHEQEQDHARLNVEATILKVLGSHFKIIKLKGEDKSGLRLELAPHGWLDEYLRDTTSTIMLWDRFKWCQQAAEATSYIHHKSVTHCDIRLGNLLLDKDFNIKLCDFQGIYRASDGSVLDGGVTENTKSYHYLLREHSANYLKQRFRWAAVADSWCYLAVIIHISPWHRRH